VTENNNSFPTGAFLLFGMAFLAYIVLNRTKMGRYIFAIGSNKDAARLSGVDVQKWQMMAYVISGFMAGLGGIAFAAVYTTVMPAQGSGFELYAIAGAVIGGTSLSGGAGSVLGTMIGVYIMSMLRAGLPSMDLQAQYQTFFTGVVVIGAVLLDIYRNKKASEVKILTPAGTYHVEMTLKIEELRKQVAHTADMRRKGELNHQLAALRTEMKSTYIRMRQEEKDQLARLKAEEKDFEKTVGEKS
jgi:ribose transport system permease protein